MRSQLRADRRFNLRGRGRDRRRHLERQRRARRNRHLAVLGQTRRGRRSAAVLLSRGGSPTAGALLYDEFACGAGLVRDGLRRGRGIAAACRRARTLSSTVRTNG
jgi:hypothetical protein